jgi:hypothetical protein
MTLPDQAERRMVEIMYFHIYHQLKAKVPNEKFHLFFESFCRVFDLDYTSISIVNNQFVDKLQPEKIEKTIYAIITGAKLKDLKLDYRTIRAHKKKVESGEHQLFPRIMNRFILDDVRKFVRRFLGLFPEDAPFMHTYYLEGGLDNDFSRSSGNPQD